MSPLPDLEKVNWGTVGYHARSAFAVILSLAVLIGGGWFVYDRVNQAYMEWRTEDDYVGEGGEEVEVVIPRGANVTQTGDILTEEGVVRSTKAFRNAAQRSGRSEELSYGRFKLKKELPAATALEMLLNPDNEVRLWVTFPEGTNMAEQASIIANTEELGVDMETVNEAYRNPSQYKLLPEWTTGLQGVLFPARYQVAEPVEVSAIIARQLRQFETISERTNLEARAESMGLTPLEVLTVASIIEGEVRDAEYQPMVAAVIYNRLETNMALGMDSTVHFAVGKSGRVATTAEDRANPSPYNTYVHRGLPPGPINNPGESAIEAALSPADTDALYFVTVNLDTGETRFAATAEGHEENRAAWRTWCRETGSDLC